MYKILHQKKKTCFLHEKLPENFQSCRSRSYQKISNQNFNQWLKISRKVTPVKRKQLKVAKIYASIRSKLVWKILQNFVQNAKLSSSSEMIFKSTENFLGKLNTKKDSSNTTTSKV